MSDLASSKGEKTGHYYGSLRVVETVLRNYHANIIFCLDSWPEEKYKLLPDYKSGRPDPSFSLKEVSLNFVKMATAIPGVYCALKKGIEADEIMASVVKRYSEKILLLTGDNDLLQLIDGERVKVIRKIKKSGIEYVTDDYIKQKFEVNPNKILFYRILVGDDSDKIPGVFSESDARQIIRNYDTLDDFLDNLIIGSKEYNSLIRNRELMELRNVDFSYWKSSYEEAKELAERFELKMFLNLLDTMKVIIESRD